MSDKTIKHDRLIDVQNAHDDFGFTFTSEQELLTINPLLEEYKRKLKALRSIFLPLLENLNKDTDKPMIKWPNRGKILDEQIKRLKELTDV